MTEYRKIDSLNFTNYTPERDAEAQARAGVAVKACTVGLGYIAHQGIKGGWDAAAKAAHDELHGGVVNMTCLNEKLRHLRAEGLDVTVSSEPSTAEAKVHHGVPHHPHVKPGGRIV